MKDKITDILKTSFNIRKLTLQDESDLHKSHPEAKASGGGHFRLLIIADDFKGKSMMKRHRMIYTALGDLMKSGIHALSIKAYSPDESA